MEQVIAIAVLIVLAIVFAVCLMPPTPQPTKAARPVAEIPRNKKPKHQWPDCDPIDKSDEFWEFNNNININGIHYKKKEVEPGKWQFVVNEELERIAAERQRHRRELFWALRSRVLTDKEMAEVGEYGRSLNIEPMVCYKQEDKDKELNAALLQQFRMRHAASPKQLSD